MLINTGIKINELTNLHHLPKMKCYDFDLSHFMQNNLNLMIDYLTKNNNDEFQQDIGIDLSGKVHIGDLSENIYAYSKHEVFGIRQQVYHDHCLNNIKQTAIDILNEYLQWLLQLIKSEEKMNCREINELLTGTINISTKVVFSQIAYVDWLIPRLPLFNINNRINLIYFDDDIKNINYFISKLLLALPHYQKLSAYLLDSLLDCLSFYTITPYENVDLANFAILIREIYQLVTKEKYKLLYDSDISYNRLLELASFTNITDIQLPLNAIPAICHVPRGTINVSALRKATFVAMDEQDVRQFLIYERNDCKHYTDSLSLEKGVCANIDHVDLNRFKPLLTKVAEELHKKPLKDDSAKQLTNFLDYFLTKY